MAWHAAAHRPDWHLLIAAGFMLFVALTVATIYAQPAPVALGTQKLLQLEQLVVSAGRSGWQVGRHATASPTWLPSAVHS